MRDFCLKHNIKLAVLFGSRAKGEPRPDSDWDLAILFKKDFYDNNKNNLAGLRKNLLKELCLLLETSQVDLVILNRVSPFLRYQVAKSGIPLFEETKNDFAREFPPGLRPSRISLKGSDPPEIFSSSVIEQHCVSIYYLPKINYKIFVL